MKNRTSVIIVDNNEVLLKMLREGLSKEGYHCETTTSSGTALERIAEDHFDILITDIVMPGLDGFELTEKARELRPDLAVIIMTGFIDDFSYDRAMEAGAADFIKKPFTLSEMKIRLQHVAAKEKQHETQITDELTGLFNRRGFFMLAEQQLKLAYRFRTGMFMLCATLDNLKTIRDTFGRHEGDQGLIDMARLLKATFQEADVIARTGEKEFAAIPVGFTADDVKTAADSLRANIEKHNSGKNQKYPLSVSSGMAYYDPGNPSSVNELLAAGDRICAHAVSSGKS
jgi:diguanylate cyclase (GGDEF)-like protein